MTNIEIWDKPQKSSKTSRGFSKPIAAVEASSLTRLFILFILCIQEFHEYRFRHKIAYFILILSSLLDIVFTLSILARGGIELNPIVNSILNAGGLISIVLYKIVCTFIVIVLSEILSHRRHDLGQLLSTLAATITCLPVMYSIIQLSS